MKPHLLALSLTALAMPLPLAAQEAERGQDMIVAFVGAGGETVGTARLIETPVGVLIGIELDGLPADQWVAFHVHEHGLCDAEADHETAGDHFNPTGAAHGFLAEGGPHAGDMPNLWVSPDGAVRAEVLNTFVTLSPGDTSILGRSLMIHAGPDDHASQPSGDAGDRLACATIE